MMISVWRLSYLGAITATLTLGSLPVLGQPSAPPTQNLAPEKVTFFCRDVYDSASGEKIPATLVWIPERQGNIRIIGWKSEFFARFGWNPQTRCKAVTPKFQAFYEAGQLKYLTTGFANGYPIVCALSQTNDNCDQSRQLFTLKPHDNPRQVLHQLMDILRGQASDFLLQNSNGETLVPIPEFFRKAPIADCIPPGRGTSGGTQATSEEDQCPSK